MTARERDRSIKQAIAKHTQNVFIVFNQINKVQNASKAQVFELVKLFRSDPTNFQNTFELAYLKIFKIFHEKANRKMPPKFQHLAANFFQEVLSKNQEGSGVQLFNFFLNFLAQATFSAILGIRITSARMLFHLIKQGVNEVAPETKVNILKSIFYLVRLKVSTYKQIGIKLASLVFSWQHQLRDKIEQELFKILSTEDNEQIRKMAITNVSINSKNIGRVLIRLRDKSSQIRGIILKKLIGQRFKLEDMTVSNRIHLLYDGYGNKETSIQQQTLRYFNKYFDLDRNKDTFRDFIDLFQPNILLVYPHLYALFDNLIAGIIQELPIEHLSIFTKNITNELKTISKNTTVLRTNIKELICLKNIGKSDNNQLKSIFEQCIPSGLELSKVLLELIKGKDLFTIQQCLQIFTIQKSADQLGRNRMFDSLKKVVMDLQYFEVSINWSGLESDDISPKVSDSILFQRKMMLSYFDLPLISNSYDLLYEIGNAMKALWPDHYQIQLKQIMADWNNPQENSLFKEKELTIANIRKMEIQGDNRLVQSLKMKLGSIEEQLHIFSVKTRSIILILNRLRPAISMDDFLPVIKEDLAKQDQSQGLILLALYSLEQIQRVQTFMPLYWVHLSSPERIKIHLLVSLKATTDFMVKFDLSKINFNEDQQNLFTYDKFIKKLLELVLDTDPDIRILAIQGLCRIIYHNRVTEDLLSSCFIRLLLLWWETSSEQISAKSVHTISIFVKQYIERGAPQVRKLAQSLCVFFKVLLVKQTQRKTINKKKITYNLKIEQFVKRSVVIAMTVLKYHKQSRQVIWKYQDSGAELGPQQLFLLFLFKHEQIHYCIDKALNICDFYEQAPLQTIILMKKQVQIMIDETNFINRKNLQGMLNKLDEDLQDKLSVKNQQTFNEQLLQGLRKQLRQYQLLINNAANRLADQLEQSQIFVLSQDIFTGKPLKKQQLDQEQDPEINIQEAIAQIEAVIAIEDEQIIPKKSNKSNKFNNLSRISEGVEESDQKDQNQRKAGKNAQIKKNRKKMPESNDQSQQECVSQNPPQNTVNLRSRNRRKI